MKCNLRWRIFKCTLLVKFHTNECVTLTELPQSLARGPRALGYLRANTQFPTRPVFCMYRFYQKKRASCWPRFWKEWGHNDLLVEYRARWIRWSQKRGKRVAIIPSHMPCVLPKEGYIKRMSSCHRHQLLKEQRSKSWWQYVSEVAHFLWALYVCDPWPCQVEEPTNRHQGKSLGLFWERTLFW